MEMKTIYLVRHGEADNNVKNTPMYLAEDAKLTEKGREQAAFIAERASRLPVKALIASNFLRSQETAQIVSEKINLPVDVSNLFGERRGPSELVGRPWHDPETQRIETEWVRTFHQESTKVADGENFEEIVERAKRALQYLENREEANILIISHGFFLRILVAHLILREYLTPGVFHAFDRRVRTQNTGMTVLQYNSADKLSQWSMLVWNDHAHLGAIGEGKRWY
jgi:probable phosphoglycerate mutase